jgi:nitroreductase
MKDFLTLTKKRHTTYEYSSRKVSKKNIKLILEAARWAPNMANIQPWHFVVVNDIKTICKLISATQHIFYPHVYPFIHPTPPTIIVFILLNDSVKKADLLRSKSETRRQHYQELDMCLAMAVSNALHAAADIDVQSGILTPKPEVDKIIGIGNKGTVKLLVGFGYERKKAYKRVAERRRKPFNEVISYGKY